MKTRKKLVILISGNGSNLQAIIDAIQNGKIYAEISLVISNKTEALGLKRAAKFNIPTQVILAKDFSTKEAYDHYLQQIIEQYQPDLLVLAGFMRILTDNFVHHFSGKIINIHPSLLPKYKGLNTHARVLAAGDRFHGVTVHYVTPALDSGPIIKQLQCEVSENDTLETLEAKIHALEHIIYPEVIADLMCSSRYDSG